MKGRLVFALFLALISLSLAWIVPSKGSTTKGSHHHSGRAQSGGVLLLHHRVHDEPGIESYPSIDDVSLSRRQWLARSIFAAAAGVSTATAITAGNIARTTGQVVPSVVSPALAADVVSVASVCDPTVSVWKRNDGRIVYLLGTAHISSASAQLAGSLVRDIHPNGVFVELDAKRIRGSGLLAKKLEQDNGEQQQSISRVIIPNIQQISSTKSGSVSSSPQLVASNDSGGAMTATATVPSAPPAKRPNPFIQAASVAVGSSIRGMYKKLDSAGFQAGEEFVIAIREGQKVGSDIVLGDRDVEVTLQRLTEGLARTDLNRLLNDSELEESLKALAPSNSQVASNGMAGDLTNEQFREEFSSFVEVIKTKENVRKIMEQLKRAAPALYEALVSERDAYMAAGLNGLNELETIVAVMGIAHVDGVERNLEMNGWNQVKLNCATYRT